MASKTCGETGGCVDGREGPGVEHNIALSTRRDDTHDATQFSGTKGSIAQNV
jgi:hypothetical protein